MAAEALVRLDRRESVERWVSGYMRGLQEAVRPANPIDAVSWQQALGDVRRVADWEAFLHRELDEGAWSVVLVRWWQRLLPGISAAATHGVIRTAHAVRALADGVTPERVGELGRGLAYWAARYTVLPGPPVTAGRSSLADALAAVPVMTGGPEGLITTRLAELNHVGGFAASVRRLRPPLDVPSALDSLTVAFATIYMERGHQYPIPYIHGVTAPAAVRLVLPHLPKEHWRPSFDAIWQATAAIHASYGMGGSRPRPKDPSWAVDRNDLIDRAVATGDEHAIKFTEACLRQHSHRPDPIFMLAAEDAAARLR
jgi:hypothetical protein